MIVEDYLLSPEKTHILIVDDEQTIRDILEQVMSASGYRCSTAEDGQAALEFVEKAKDVDVIITDIMMPRMTGIELVDAIKDKYDCDVMVMTGFSENYSYEDIVAKGVSDFMQKPVSVRELMIRLQRVLRERAILSERNKAEKLLKQTLEKVQKSMRQTVHVAAHMGEVRDPYTAGHQRRVADLAMTIAKMMHLPEDIVEGIHISGIIHDIGKISVPSEILSKPGKLTDIEYSLIKTHAQTGYDILRDVEFPWPVAQIVHQHHERIDGRGYPLGLKGDEILLQARIMSVADVVEAMGTHRPYRAALELDFTLNEITKNKGCAFDPDVSEACLDLFQHHNYKLIV